MPNEAAGNDARYLQVHRIRNESASLAREFMRASCTVYLPAYIWAGICLGSKEPEYSGLHSSAPVRRTACLVPGGDRAKLFGGNALEASSDAISSLFKTS